MRGLSREEWSSREGTMIAAVAANHLPPVD